jgi:hypothetical protein
VAIPRPCGGRDDVAELGLGGLAVEVGRQRQPEQRGVVGCVDDHERLAGPIDAAALVARPPRGGERWVRRIREAREAADVGILG